MPDASVVEQQFVTEIGKILTGSPYQPYAVGSSEVLGGQMFRLMRGWPVDEQIVKDLAAVPPVTNITVFAQPGQRNTTRFLRQMMIQTVSLAPQTMFGELTGNQVRFEGIGSDTEVISVSLGNLKGAAMRMTAADTPDTVAQFFATALPNTARTGGTITIGSHLPISVVFGTDATNLREVHRQCAIWRVTIWARTPQLRDLFCSLIDPNLQGLDRFFFPDGSCSGPVIGAGFAVDDVTEKQTLWKRDLLYETEYPTDTVSITPVMVLGELDIGNHPIFTNVTIADELVDAGGVSGQGIINL